MWRLARIRFFSGCRPEAVSSRATSTLMRISCHRQIWWSELLQAVVGANWHRPPVRRYRIRRHGCAQAPGGSLPVSVSGRRPFPTAGSRHCPSPAGAHVVCARDDVSPQGPATVGRGHPCGAGSPIRGRCTFGRIEGCAVCQSVCTRSLRRCRRGADAAEGLVRSLPTDPASATASGSGHSSPRSTRRCDRSSWTPKSTSRRRWSFPASNTGFNA